MSIALRSSATFPSAIGKIAQLFIEPDSFVVDKFPKSPSNVLESVVSQQQNPLFQQSVGSCFAAGSSMRSPPVIYQLEPTTRLESATHVLVCIGHPVTIRIWIVRIYTEARCLKLTLK